MQETVYVLIFIGIYVLLQAYILPKMDISTWIRNACQVPGKKTEGPKNILKDDDNNHLHKIIK